MNKSSAVPTGGYVPFRGYRTWYETAGDLSSGVPVVLLHGGPGIPGGAYAQLMAQLADRRPVVRYDQLGCGRSDRPNDPSLWRVQTFVDELTALRDALGLDRVHLLGHSWGGMLAIEYLLTTPTGVQSLVLSSSLCNTRFWVEEARRLRNAMPAHIVAMMHRFEGHHDMTADAAPAPAVVGTGPGIVPEDVTFRARMMRWSLPFVTSALVQRVASWASFVPPLRRAAYEIAGMAFMRRHVCRMADFPLVLCQDYLARNQQVYETMWGPSEFFATGVLAEWNVEQHLGEIAVPTLILSGRYDEATPAQQQRLHDGIPGSRWTVLEHSAHLTFMEEPDRYREVLTAFLDDVDARAAKLAGGPSSEP
jgi:pimeloyl-ACP methyl ester carboxylesterase